MPVLSVLDPAHRKIKKQDLWKLQGEAKQITGRTLLLAYSLSQIQQPSYPSKRSVDYLPLISRKPRIDLVEAGSALLLISFVTCDMQDLLPNNPPKPTKFLSLVLVMSVGWKSDYCIYWNRRQP